MLSAIELKEVLNYDETTGIFTWKVRSSRQIRIGDVAGSVSKKDGYTRIFIKRKSYLAHRLAFVMHFGFEPECEIDHINHNRSDNRLLNLRKASKTENMRNISLQSNNTSGFMGVYWNKASKKWAAQIKVNGKNKRIGLFADKNEAIQARAKANETYGFHINHGN